MPKNSKDYFPKQIKLGHFVLTIKLLDSEIIYNLGEQQGSFESREQKIYLRRQINLYLYAANLLRYHTLRTRISILI